METLGQSGGSRVRKREMKCTRSLEIKAIGFGNELYISRRREKKDPGFWLSKLT